MHDMGSPHIGLFWDLHMYAYGDSLYVYMDSPYAHWGLFLPALLIAK